MISFKCVRPDPLTFVLSRYRYPGTVAEAVDRLYSDWPEELLAKIRDTDEDDLDLYHFSLGTEIRNSLGLWDDN